MKNTNYFLIFICMISLFVFSSCEQTELQRSTSNTDEKINTRTDDCDDCPMGDCCCFIQWVSGNMVIQLCGTTGSRLSTTECEFEDVGTCIDVIDGYILGPFDINSGERRKLFCMGQNTSFSIHVLSGSGTIQITCQADDTTSPQTVTLNVLGPNKYFYTANGDCELANCF
jgi:hypothetical protein